MLKIESMQYLKAYRHSEVSGSHRIPGSKLFSQAGIRKMLWMTEYLVKGTKTGRVEPSV